MYGNYLLALQPVLSKEKLSLISLNTVHPFLLVLLSCSYNRAIYFRTCLGLHLGNLDIHCVFILHAIVSSAIRNGKWYCKLFNPCIVGEQAFIHEAEQWMNGEQIQWKQEFLYLYTKGNEKWCGKLGRSWDLR